MGTQKEQNKKKKTPITVSYRFLNGYLTEIWIRREDNATCVFPFCLGPVLAFLRESQKRPWNITAKLDGNAPFKPVRVFFIHPHHLIRTAPRTLLTPQIYNLYVSRSSCIYSLFVVRFSVSLVARLWRSTSQPNDSTPDPSNDVATQYFQ